LQQLEIAGKKYSALDLSPLLQKVKAPFETTSVCLPQKSKASSLHNEILRKAKPALTHGKKVTFKMSICSENRTVGARLSGEITRKWGSKGLREGTLTIHFKGSAGQSFGAFCVPGMDLRLEGEANDYVGKGMAGGVISIRAQDSIRFDPGQSSIIGNTVLYGATGGELFVSGKAGERFAVRNSGATAVVEGAGHHACEYMTRGTVVILGRVSGNLGAGMSGGEAFVLDEENRLEVRYNPQMVGIERLKMDSHRDKIAQLKSLIERHLAFTNSNKAQKILENWPSILAQFWRVAPKNALSSSAQKKDPEESQTLQGKH
jgi:glutamate synthase domain-containing protein 3